jgi:hypothetical protein
MSTTGDVHVGDVGTHYQATIQDAGVPFDPSTATTAKLIFKPPAAAAFERDATVTANGPDWSLNYVLVDGVDDDFHSEAGLWRWQGYVEFADGQRYHTSVDTYMVSANLDRMT